MLKERKLKLATVTPDPATEATAPPAKSDKVSLSLVLPAELHHRLKMESLMRQRPVGALLEEWAERHASLEPVTVTAEDLNNVPEDEPDGPEIETRSLSTPVSRRVHNLARLEALRRKTTLRAVVRAWIGTNVREWIVEPVAPVERPTGASLAAAS